MSTFVTSKKTFFYNFMPSKAEEEACKATKTPYKVSRFLIEMRDLFPPPIIESFNPWKINASLSPREIVTGRIVLSAADTFEHIIRYWTMEKAKQLVMLGRNQSVVVWDVTDLNNPISYINEDMFLEQGSPDNEYYFLGCMELMRNRGLNPGDEIGLYWEIRSSTFQFKLLRRF